MLSQAQITQLQTRVSQLRRELQENIEILDIEGEHAIDQELALYLDKLNNNKDDSNLVDLVQGLTKASNILKLINLINEWVQQKQVNKQLHRNHPELTAIGFIFSPRASSQPTPQPSDPGKIYKEKVRKQVESELQDEMQFLYDMGITDFNTNLKALKLALTQGAQKDQLVDFAYENIQNQQTLTLPVEEEKKQEESYQTLDKKLEESKKILVRKNISDEKVNQQNEKPQVMLQTLEQVMKAVNFLESLEDKLKLLEELIIEGKQNLYLEVLQNLDELASSEQYQQMKMYLDSLVLEKDWNSININLIQNYLCQDPNEIIYKHSAVKYFQLFHSEEKNEVMSPLLIKAIIQGIEQVIKIENDYQTKFQLKQLQRNFQEGKIDEAMKVCNSISNQQKLNKVFQEHSLKHFQYHLELKSSVLDSLEQLNLEQKFKQSTYFKTLTQTISISCEKTLIINCFIQLHQKQDPQFNQNNFLSLIKVYKILNDHLNIGILPSDFIEKFIEDQSNFQFIKKILSKLEQ